MQLAAHVLAYNVDRFIDHTLQNCAPHVDKIFVTYAHRPWGYIAESREGKRNPTTLERVHLAVERLHAALPDAPPVEIIVGDWPTDEETRNAALSSARAEGFDWLIIQDADEFYTDASWEMMKSHLLAESGLDLFRTTWYLFWKSSQLVIEHCNGSIKDNNVGFAIRCKPGASFVRSRTSNAENVRLIDASCYHYAYVMDDAQIREKVTTWGHAHQFSPDVWLAAKWAAWTQETRNLHPVHPYMWKRAVRFPNEQPAFACHFDLAVDLDRAPLLREELLNLTYDAKAQLRRSASLTKRRLASALTNSARGSD